MSFTHKELCEMARKWLQRPVSRLGHGCEVALRECRTGYKSEIPDAIGFRTKLPYPGSVLIEVKASRADFLADAKKGFRDQDKEGLAVGNFRYYFAPVGLIALEELAPKWGLIEVTNKGHIKVRAGLAKTIDIYESRESAHKWRFDDVNTDGERFLLVRALANTDPQKTLDYTRAIANSKAALDRHVADIAKMLGIGSGEEIYRIKRSIEKLVERNEKTRT